jgi:hypothetical protein
MTAHHSMLLNLIVALFFLVSGCAGGSANDDKLIGNGVVSAGTARGQQALLVEWVKALKPETDYKGSPHWKSMTQSSSPERFFNVYNEKFSKIAEKLGAYVNFISIGACDGTNDDTIKDRFLANPHWFGVFVEPMSNNFADLTNFLAVSGVANRSTTIRGAAYAECKSPSIEVQRPLGINENLDQPHWLRRQIGGILKEGEKPRAGWTIEKVQLTDDLLDACSIRKFTMIGINHSNLLFMKLIISHNSYPDP